MIEMAISSWSVHGLLGGAWYLYDSQNNLIEARELAPGAMPLQDLPAFIASDGIRLMELCNTHLPSLDDDYLAQLRSALDDAGVTLVNLLVDTGNLSASDEDDWRAEIASAKRWQDVAVKLGAKGLRFDCGTEAPTESAIKRSSAALRELADYGAGLGLNTTTENWRATSVQSENLLRIMDEADRPLKLCVDFGNASKTGDKYATMQALLPRATSLHCKGYFNDGALDTAEFYRSMSLVKDAGFDGHVVLIDDGTEDEWRKVLTLKRHVEAQLLS